MPVAEGAGAKGGVAMGLAIPGNPLGQAAGMQQGGGKKSTPAAPDFTQAALQTAMQGRQGAREQTYANRPNINTPWGSYNWTVTPGQGDPFGGMQQAGMQQAGGGGFNEGAGGASIADAMGLGQPQQDAAAQSPTAEGYNYTPETWQMDVNLSPEQQAIFESQQRAQGGRAGLAEDAVGRARDALGQPIESGMDARNRAEQAIYQRAASRLDPRFAQQEDQYRTRLYNQGLREGDEAFTQQMNDFGRMRNDAYQNAMNESIMGGGQEMSRQFSQGLQGRGALLNELQALMGGQQVGMPQQPGFQGAGGYAPPDFLGAAGQQYGANINQYNAGQAQQQSMQQALMMLPFLFSDERLKTDIHRLSIEALPGVPYASWRWKAGGRGFGVIAQDMQRVRPDLVIRDKNTGFLMVNYAGI